jgi:FixJ family two-component response regulator
LWLLRQVRERWPTLPVVMVCGAESEQMVLEAKRLGAVGFVPKPFAREMLYQAVLKATSGDAV